MIPATAALNPPFPALPGDAGVAKRKHACAAVAGLRMGRPGAAGGSGYHQTGGDRVAQGSGGRGPKRRCGVPGAPFNSLDGDKMADRDAGEFRKCPEVSEGRLLHLANSTHRTLRTDGRTE